MRARRLAWVLCLLAGCTCAPGEGMDAGVPLLDAGSDAGVTPDAGVDAGSAADAGVDSGTIDSGFDAGRDAGALDGGDDAGLLPGCSAILCPPWQRCSEMAGVARCLGTVTIAWVSPVPGASAPADLQSIPLAIDTNADSTVDVPWRSLGVLASAGTFSGQSGVRGATLFLADADAGVVVLTAGWDGGPNASIQLMLTGPLVRPPPVPSFGTNGPDFEPNDPAGNAFRRDDVVPIEVNDLPPPIALFAKLDAPNARASAYPATQRCDGGTCWVVNLPLGELDFPAFRGRVLVWASGADGGIQTRPRSIPVTRWRWRRQVSGVPNPMSVTRPTTSRARNFEIAVGSSDTSTTGRLLNLSPNGSVRPLPIGWPQGNAVSSILGWTSESVATNTADGGLIVHRGGATIASPDRILACTSYNELSLCSTDRGGLVVMYGAASPFSVDWSSTDAGCPPSISPGLALSNLSGAVVSESASLCSVQLAIPAAIVSAQPSTTSTLRAFANLFGTLAAAGTDGGVWYVPFSGAPGALASPSELVDGIAAETRSGLNGSERAHWATADRRVHSARYGFVSTGPVPFSSVITSNELLPGRSATTPVVAYDERLDGGSVLYVTRNGAVVAFDADSLRRTWTLEPGDAGIRGGRIDTEPIGFEYCGRHGGLLVPSSGDGSLYSFILDGPSFTWQLRSPWAMSGRTPQNDQSSFQGPCTSD